MDDYSELNEGLQIDCRQVLEAVTDTETIFTRFYSSQKELNENFKSYYEDDEPLNGSSPSETYIAMHRGVSISEVLDASNILDSSMKTLNSMSKNILSKKSWDTIYVFTISCTDELVARTPGHQKAHCTMLKSNHFNGTACLAEVELLSIDEEE